MEYEIRLYNVNLFYRAFPYNILMCTSPGYKLYYNILSNYAQIGIHVKITLPEKNIQQNRIIHHIYEKKRTFRVQGNVFNSVYVV